jgi:hypothetical protein
VHYSNGIDDNSCGEEADHPCQSLAYAVDKAQSGDEVRLLDGATRILSFSYLLPVKRFTVRGIPTDDGQQLYPEIFMNGEYEDIFLFARRCQATLDSFRVLVDASAHEPSRFFLRATCIGNDGYVRIKFANADYFYGYFFYFSLFYFILFFFFVLFC